MSDTLANIKLAISQSEQLLTMADNEQWEEFEKLESTRQTIIAQIQTNNLQLLPQQHQLIQAQLAKLVELNQSLETKCGHQRQVLAKDMQKLNKGNKAIKAYSG